MSSPKLLPFASDTVKCKVAWKKGMALKIVEPFEFEPCAATEDADAVAADDRAVGEYGTVYYAGIIPIAVKNSSGNAGAKLYTGAGGYFSHTTTLSAGSAAPAKGMDDWDYDANANEVGLVTALFFSGNFQK